MRPWPLIALTSSLLAGSAGAAEAAPRPTLRLLPAWTHATPGADLELGLHFDLPEGWHIYWTNPGDSGMPTEASFTGPAGATFSPTRYPAPERIESAGGIVNYAYSGETALFTTTTVPADTTDRFGVRAEATWLLCRDVCVLQSGEASASVPVPRRVKQVRPANAARLSRARSRVPAPLEEPAAWKRSRRDGGWRLEVALDGNLPAELLPSAELEALLDDHALRWEGGAVVLRIEGRTDEAGPESVAGVLSLDQHGGRRWYRLDLPVRAAAWADAPVLAPPGESKYGK